MLRFIRHHCRCFPPTIVLSGSQRPSPTSSIPFPQTIRSLPLIYKQTPIELLRLLFSSVLSFAPIRFAYHRLNCHCGLRHELLHCLLNSFDLTQRDFLHFLLHKSYLFLQLCQVLPLIMVGLFGMVQSLRQLCPHACLGLIFHCLRFQFPQ
jgi:hypothetical protein